MEFHYPRGDVVITMNGQPFDGPYTPPPWAIQFLADYIVSKRRRELSEERAARKAQEIEEGPQ